jgi:glycosyltransferase involved in cell wall biosynthesis
MQQQAMVSKLPVGCDRRATNDFVAVSVIIPAYNSATTIKHTLDHLLIQTRSEQILEIIVVDSSDDGITKGVIGNYVSDKVRLITSGVRVMPAIQRNVGAKNARGDILCFIDSDAYPMDDWIERILEAYSNGIRVGGGSYLVPEFQRDNRVAVAQYYLEFSEYIGTGKPRLKRIVPTCNMFCEKLLFDRVGGIPEIRASEDVLFCLHVGKFEKLVFFPEVKVYHIFRESLDHFLTNQILLGKYIFVYRKRYYNSRYLDRPYFSVLFPVFLGIKFLRICSRVAYAGPAHWGRFVRSAPLFFKGLRYWGKGLSQGSKEYDSFKDNLKSF